MSFLHHAKEAYLKTNNIDQRVMYEAAFRADALRTALRRYSLRVLRTKWFYSGYRLTLVLHYATPNFVS